MLSGFLFFLVILFFVLIVILAAIKIVQEYERGVVFRLGRFAGVRGPGLILLIPFIERMVKVDLRVVALDIPAQECITRDNVTVKVNAVVYFFVLDPEKAVIHVEDYRRATWQVAQTTLRSTLGQHELDDLLSRRERINMELQRIIDEVTEPWGIKVNMVEVKDVELPATMQRAMARQAEAERDRRAKVISAEGDYAASQQLSKAAQVMYESPGAMQLRYLQTLTEIATEQNSTIIFPLPLDLFRAFLGSGDATPRAAPASPAAVPAPEAALPAEAPAADDSAAA